MQASSVVN